MNSSSKNNFLVSVIIPCYNVENYIDECVESVQNQNYKYIELICIDNASTDNTYQRLIKLKSKYNFKLYQCPSPGANNARNLGIKKSLGLWLQFLDADDILYTDKINHQINLIKNSKEDIDFIVASSLHKDLKLKVNTSYPLEDKFIGLLKSNFGNTCSNLFKKQSLIEIDCWNVNLKSSQEYDLIFRMIKNDSKFILDLNPLTLVRERRFGQISIQNPKLKWNQYVKLRLEIINYLKQAEPSYYISNEMIINQILFDILRILIKYDRYEALRIHREYLYKFKPKKSPSNGTIYLIFYKIFGFELTEKIRSIFNLDS